MTSVSKTSHTDNLYDIVDEYNSTYHRTMKMRSIDVKSRMHIDFAAENMIKILNLKLVTMKEDQNIKTIL